MQITIPKIRGEGAYIVTYVMYVTNALTYFACTVSTYVSIGSVTVD